jgi:hypothetical protein
LVHAHGANIKGGSILTIRKNKEALLLASKETGLKVNADVMQNAGRSLYIHIDNSSFERVGEFK